MKLKYYLRGLGIGMLVSAFIMGVVANGETMTDKEIKARAAELGMVEQKAVTLSDLIDGEDEGKSENPIEKTMEDNKEREGASQEPTGEIDDSREDSEGGTQETIDESVGSQESALEAISTGESEETAEASTEASEDSGQSDDGLITVVIEWGESSLSVSRSLEAAGLVEDASEYDRYLCDNGYSKTLRAGTYKIAKGSSEEEIARIIIGR